jgi:germination protein M
MAASKRNNKRSGSNAGTVFWLAAIVIVLFLFALNWGKIQETLERTNFHEIVKTQTGTDKAPEGPKASKDKATPPSPQAPTASPSAAPSPSAATKPQDKTAPRDGGAAGRGDEPETGDAASPNAGEKPIASGPKMPKTAAESGTGAAREGTKPPRPATAPVVARSRPAALFFVRIDDDGTIVRQETKRQIPASDSPLLDSLAALLKGPSEDELRKSLITLVPEGTKLLSAQVRGSTAYLNFNEAFMYNHYGIEGYAGQLKQVVYTATAFPTVQDVQILIEGSKRDYLGGEGVFIGRPLSRNSF